MQFRQLEQAASHLCLRACRGHLYSERLETAPLKKSFCRRGSSMKMTLSTTEASGGRDNCLLRPSEQTIPQPRASNGKTTR